MVERCINRLKQWRGLATRYKKRAVNFRALVILASIVIWLEAALLAGLPPRGARTAALISTVNTILAIIAQPRKA